MSTFGQRLKDLRNLAHLTQTQLAKFLGMSRENISLYENGKNKSVPDPVVQQLAQLFHVPATYIRGEEEIDTASLKRMLPVISIDFQETKDGERHAYGSIDNKTVELTPHTVDLADDDVPMTFEGRPIDSATIEIFRAILRNQGGDDK